MRGERKLGGEKGEGEREDVGGGRRERKEGREEEGECVWDSGGS